MTKRTCLFLNGLAILFLTMPAYGSDDELWRCANINDNAKRLICYDELAEKRGVAPPAILDSKDIGSWMVWDKTSKIDDSTNVFVLTEVSAPIFLAHGGKAYPSLTIACREDKTSLWVNAREYLGSKAISVKYRIGKLSAVISDFQLSTDWESFGLWHGGDAIPFIKKLFGHETVLMRYIPYGDSARTVEFPISGLKRAIRPLAASCNWSID